MMNTTIYILILVIAVLISIWATIMTIGFVQTKDELRKALCYNKKK